MSDLISRKEAMEALANLTCFGIEEIKVQCEASVADSEGWIGGIRDAVIELEALPSSEPERKKGRWIDVTEIIGFPDFKCSVCQSKSGSLWMNFCPNCGR